MSDTYDNKYILYYNETRHISIVSISIRNLLKLPKYEIIMVMIHKCCFKSAYVSITRKFGLIGIYHPFPP